MDVLTPEEIRRLADQYLHGTISAQDRQRLDDWYQSMPEQIEWADAAAPNRVSLEKALWASIQAARQEEPAPRIHRVHFLRRYRWWAAASLLLVCSATWFLLPKRNGEAVQTAKADIQAPVTNKATLTIDGKRQIVLEGLASGSLAQAGVAGVTKQDGHTLAYSSDIASLAMHTWSNPVASQPLALTLPDGTRVWLNAASTISFPSRFTDKERVVSVTGEAYFEVKHNAAQPFKVKAGNQTIEDVGTAFNVNAYRDETGVRTTLIEGVVKVQEKAVTKTLKPGEDFFNGQVAEANTDQAMAWKNGLFSFGNTVDLGTALRQIGRWYGIEIVYEEKVPDREFGGKLPRSLSLNKVLEILSEQKVHARIEGNRLIVQP